MLGDMTMQRHQCLSCRHYTHQACYVAGVAVAFAHVARTDVDGEPMTFGCWRRTGDTRLFNKFDKLLAAYDLKCAEARANAWRRPR